MSTRRPTKELGAEQGLGVMSRLPHCTLVRGYVLNSLENGPARVADLVQRGRVEFGFTVKASRRFLEPGTRSNHLFCRIYADAK